MKHLKRFNEELRRKFPTKTEEVQDMLADWEDITDIDFEELPNNAHCYHFKYKRKPYTLYCNSENTEFKSVCTPPRPGRRKTLPTYSLKTPRIVIECWADREMPQLLSMLYNYLRKESQ